MNVEGFLPQAFVFLVAAVLTVPVFKRLGLSPVLAYLCAGIIVGPSALGLVRDVESIMHVSEFGVVMLLFLIGLELNPRRLWAMRRAIFVSGLFQVAATAVVTGGFVSAVCGLGWRSSAVIGAAFSLSSTAIAMELLKERNLLKTPGGEQSFAILLFQDIAVIPILAALPLLAVHAGDSTQSGAGDGWLALLKTVGIFVATFALGRLLVRPAFRFIASTGLREAFTAFALLIVVGIAVLMSSLGLSMALGTFLAGVILADSEYRHELEVDLEPFKGLLLGLFFMSVGMSMKLAAVGEAPFAILLAVAAIVAAKAAILWLIARMNGVDARQRPLVAPTMSQVGEFAFVILTLGVSLGVVSQNASDQAGVVAALSMLVTPLALKAYERACDKKLREKDPRAHDEITGSSGNVIIAGFGRFGQMVGRVLHAHGIPTTVMDHDPTQIDMLRRFNYKVFYGDATRLELLEAAGAREARLLVVAVDDPQTALAIIEMTKQHFPTLKILARARNRQTAYDMLARGIDDPVREVLDGSLSMAERALTQLGFHAYRARRAVLRFREHDRHVFYETARMRKEGHEEKAVVSYVNQTRQQLEQLMNVDAEEQKELQDLAWG